MSMSYNPARNATAVQPWETAFLSERDLSGQVPLNFVTHPGIFVTAACFPDQVYDIASAGLCISNLLASQMRRYIIDIYWDSVSRNYRLCPLQIPSNMFNDTGNQAYNIQSARGIPMPANGLWDAVTNVLNIRQTTSANSSTTSAIVPNSTITEQPIPTSNGPPISTTTGVGGELLAQSGSVECSPDLDINSLIKLLNDYLVDTSNTLDARLIYLIFNLRAATPAQGTQSPGPLTGSELPTTKELLSTYFGEIDQYFYSPKQLLAERQNLNNSWYRQSDPARSPLKSYFSTNIESTGVYSTPDGWPNEDWVQLTLGRRLILGYSTTDPLMVNYDYEGDKEYLYPPEALWSNHETTIDSSTGRITSGCFYNASETQLSQINSSWANSIITTTDPFVLGMAADNLTICGISPILNATLNGAPADVQPDPYQNYGNQALFSWADGQPVNDTARPSNVVEGQFRCALMLSNANYTSHWRVENCQQKYPVACRVSREQYIWEVSTNPVAFAAAAGACTGNGSFDAPRTGLENDYLYHQILNDSLSQDNTDLLNGVWVNFNSLDTESCWVTAGADSKCPYKESEDNIHHRQILVPAIAAFIVILLTALTVLVKCTNNRRNSKVRKRGEGGWDYEGVPS